MCGRKVNRSVPQVFSRSNRPINPNSIFTYPAVAAAAGLDAPSSSLSCRGCLSPPPRTPHSDNADAAQLLLNAAAAPPPQPIARPQKPPAVGPTAAADARPLVAGGAKARASTSRSAGASSSRRQTGAVPSPIGLLWWLGPDGLGWIPFLLVCVCIGVVGGQSGLQFTPRSVCLRSSKHSLSNFVWW